MLTMDILIVYPCSIAPLTEPEISQKIFAKETQEMSRNLTFIWTLLLGYKFFDFEKVILNIIFDWVNPIVIKGVFTFVSFLYLHFSILPKWLQVLK